MNSATVQIVEDEPLYRSHVLMNKFRDKECSDSKKVDRKIKEITEKIRGGSPLKQADDWIRKKWYDGQDPDRSHEETATTSPFSLFTRQKVEIPDKTTHVKLKSTFEQRESPNGQMKEPRRILIRGRAGSGKPPYARRSSINSSKKMTSLSGKG
ncbi:uncharacterized protein B0I36DRAFT_356360 [Microdochium trichocladiopsis]|uniref:Uncharacterized protein n=1 Tax=Microdochium trichocladiopsis TaxID=1682393 RepID=A0A9P8XSR4_9PEZI|nr:uncharacterized protein B0I36DRAFT_356360 [Microdochium trichocladiopsis]KAH7012290.1 hypothetical protein B0I36DRAFT_356360 [Microdochium trichocladiopsis]